MEPAGGDDEKRDSCRDAENFHRMRICGWHALRMIERGFAQNHMLPEILGSHLPPQLFAVFENP